MTGASYLTPLCLRFPVCAVGIVVTPSSKAAELLQADAYKTFTPIWHGGHKQSHLRQMEKQNSPWRLPAVGRFSFLPLDPDHFLRQSEGVAGEASWKNIWVAWGPKQGWYSCWTADPEGSSRVEQRRGAACALMLETLRLPPQPS